MISESDILECFQRLVDSSYHKDSILLGSGDDAAVIDTQGKYLVHSVDISKIGVHFHESMRPEDIAYRSITTALSDLAGMGCFPSFISIALTSDIEEISWYERFSNGIKETLDEFSIDLVGGDVTKGELNVSVNVFGYPFQNPITRSGAKPNESIYITGQLGKAKQGLDDWLNKKSSIYCQSYLRPKPQFQKAKEISDFASSCIDISDGLMKDLGNICAQSKVNGEIYFEDIPITNDYHDLSYGDDYELCFTAPSNLDDQLRDQGFFLIGKTTQRPELFKKYSFLQVFMKNGSTIDFKRGERGWDPFSKQKELVKLPIMNSKKTLKNPIFFIASLGGIGLIRFAPGTFGSIFAWFLFIFLSHYLNMIILTSLAFLLAIWVCEYISKDLEEKDDKSIVIDELVGMWIALMPAIYFAETQSERMIIAILALVLFRVFDIFKPFPINYFDQRFKNGFGIVIDDVVAGIITLLILIPLSFLLF